MNPFDLSNWFWIVANDSTKVFSSKDKDYVPTSNITYQRWLAAGNAATKIDTEANLGGVLASVGDMALQPIPAGVLDGYSNVVADRITATYVNRLLFEYENRLRTLEGQPAMTPQEFRQKIKGLV
jgi:hypothetical protein